LSKHPSQPFPFRIEFPPELPISARAEEIVATIQANPVVILAGETGSGKTTQIPKMCLLAGRGVKGRIACTQPRRVAALSISRRVAEELGVEWGREVGCKVRFSDDTSNETLVKFLTDGMLLAEVQGDPMLRGYDTVIIDEAHERSLNIDFLIGHLRQLRFRRPELKIIITSATIDTQAFSEAFDGAPVIQVSGRTYPVETIYMPLDQFGTDYSEEEEDPTEEAGSKESAKAEALHYVDGAVEAVLRIIEQNAPGDILVFMPSERDIREACELLEPQVTGRRGGAELVPLFGRLTNEEQQRVFARTQRRKVVVATNIAETSLTIPGIRYVIDTGLSRFSRYSPQARTRRLPIEPVSQSSADQRKGRAGRVAEGVCIRLYSEKDFEARPKYTQPEIQRANLADVILRLKAFGLGDIERFPFINPPAPKAIRAGYGLLEELGAIVEADEALAGKGRGARGERQSAQGGSEGSPASPRPGFEGSSDGTSYNHVLTPVGRELARLPVDPTVGRMILQARSEKCLREVMIIAAGLSIQDPRERPLDKQAAADAAHKRFAHPDSDFLTLLNIWEAVHDEVERLSQSRLRRFCRDHFLSYVRMREWRDIHQQLLEVMRERRDFVMTSVRRGSAAGEGRGGRGEGQSRQGGSEGSPASPRPGIGSGRKSDEDRSRVSDQEEAMLVYGSSGYRSIHRSILSGLLGNIAYLDEETRSYKATNDRRVNLFPGSVLFRKEERRKQGADGGRQPVKQAKTPRWIMASEIVETTRIYARTCAKLDARWLNDIAHHLIKLSHSEPYWNQESGRVLVRERARLYGLEIDSRSVGYGKIKPVHATEIFIREALVNDTLTGPLDFISHNRRVREKIEFSLTRTRDSGYLNMDEALFRFYEQRLLPSADERRGARGEGPLAQGGSEASPASSRPGIGASGPGADDPSAFRPVSCVAELVDLVRERRTNEPRFLMIEPEDLRDPESLRHDAEAFPENLPLQNSVIPINYAYKPGKDDDGVTVEVNVRDADALTPEALDWAVPGHTQEKVEHYLRALPKELRRELVPFNETVPQVTQAVEQLMRLRGGGMLTSLLAEYLRERFRFKFDPGVWGTSPLPEHLRVRVRVNDDQGRELCAGRDLPELKELLAKLQAAAALDSAKDDPIILKRARAKWEKAEAETWVFGDVPSVVTIGEQAGLPLPAYPALKCGENGVALRLVRSSEEAAALTREGLSRLLELAISRELTWLERDLKSLRQLGAVLTLIAPLEKLAADAFDCLRRWLTDPSRVHAVTSQSGSLLTANAFASAVERQRNDLRGLVPRVIDMLREPVELRHQLSVLPNAYEGMVVEAKALMPADFLRTTPFAQWVHLGRYMKAKKLRAERWRSNPSKDAERVRLLAPHARKAVGVSRSSRYYWLVEEYRVSLFAQELGTAESVSPNKLERAWEEQDKAPVSAVSSAASTSIAAAVSASVPASPSVESSPSPIVPAASPKSPEVKKTAPLKSLNALDAIFARRK
jgi:ATP-dependent helicase HrpA